MTTSGYVGRRLLWMLPSLLGITLVTFLLMDLAPGSRAELALDAGEITANTDAAHRARMVQTLRQHWGMVDPETGEEYSVFRRYLAWLGRACTLDLAGPGTDRDLFWQRITRALPVTMLVNLLALLLALGVAIPLGARLGMSRGTGFDHASSAGLFLVYGVPEFLVATLLVVLFCGGIGDAWLPVRGLRSDDASRLSTIGQVLDMASHLVLPVITLAIAPAVVVMRFLRESVARAARSDFVATLRAWGSDERVVRRRALHNGLSPLVTMFGLMLPGLVGGSVVVENVFGLPGLGRLAFEAALAQEHPMVMAMTLLVGVATLIGLLVSDLLHRLVDPRVRLR